MDSEFNINGIQVKNVNLLGMCLVRWTYEGCEANFGIGDDFATLYSIESKVKGKGYATFVLSEAKKYYEDKGKSFGGTVALNDTMRHIYNKLEIKEYDC